MVERSGGGQADSIAAEAAAWREQQHAARSWSVSRSKCAFWGLATPVILAAITWVVVLATADREGYSAELAAPSALIALVLGFVLSLELLVLAVRGGGLTATPQGLEYHLAHANGLLLWTDIAGASAEQDIDVKGRTYPVLAIRLRRRVRRWPLSIVLWGSKPDRLSITSYIFPGPVAAIGMGIDAALDDRGLRTSATSGPDAGVAIPVAMSVADLRALQVHLQSADAALSSLAQDHPADLPARWTGIRAWATGETAWVDNLPEADGLTAFRTEYLFAAVTAQSFADQVLIALRAGDQSALEDLFSRVDDVDAQFRVAFETGGRLVAAPTAT